MASPTTQDTNQDDLEINPADFQSIKVAVELYNNTTRTKPKTESTLQMVQHTPPGLVLEIPKNACAHGHNLTLTVSATLPDQSNIKFETTAKVDSHKSTDVNYDEITILFLQFDDTKWRSFTDSFSKRQAAIEAFFASVRG